MPHTPPTSISHMRGASQRVHALFIEVYDLAWKDALPTTVTRLRPTPFSCALCGRHGCCIPCPAERTPRSALAGQSAWAGDSRRTKQLDEEAASVNDDPMYDRDRDLD